MYYPCSENKGADQLCGYMYHEADLRLCFRICKKSGFLMTRLNLFCHSLGIQYNYFGMDHRVLKVYKVYINSDKTAFTRCQVSVYRRAAGRALYTSKHCDLSYFVFTEDHEAGRSKASKLV